jgi:hypothetical protein
VVKGRSSSKTPEDRREFGATIGHGLAFVNSA